MGPIIFRRGKIEYIFHSDRLEIIKKDKMVREVKYNEIKKISYNPERGLKDLISMLLVPSLAHFYLKDSFVIELKNDTAHKWKILGFPLPKEVFEKIKGILGVEITLV